MAFRQIRLWNRNDVEGFGCVIEVRNQNEAVFIDNDYIYSMPMSEFEQLKRTQPNAFTMQMDAQALLGIYEQNCGGKSYTSYLVLVTGSSLVGRVLNDTMDICKLTTVSFVSLQRRGLTDDDQVSDLRKMLQSGDFYFAVPSQSSTSTVSYNLVAVGKGDGQSDSDGPRGICWDLTRSVQNTVLRIDDLNDEFVWNRTLLSPLTRFGLRVDALCVRLICGYVEMRTVYAADLQLRVTLVSRVSAARSGTRFSVRGSNEFGDVANFVETEQIVFAGGSIVSHLQLRGTVPLIWDQPGVQVGSHRIRMPRSRQLGLAAFDRHTARLIRAYAVPGAAEQMPSPSPLAGDRGNLSLNLTQSRRASKLRLLLLSLLQNQKDEGLLTRAYLDHFNVLRKRYEELYQFIGFDYHDQLKRFGQRALESLMSTLRVQLADFSLFFFEAVPDGDVELGDGLRGRVVRVQNGLVRTNCLDCLDRTNATQTLVGMDLVATMLACLVPVLRNVKDPQTLLTKLNDAYRQLWVQNGDRISHIYAGTGAIGTQSKLKDVQRSATRTIKNNFMDDSRHGAIENLLYTASRLEPRLLHKTQALLGNRALTLSYDTLEQVVLRRWQFCEMLPIRVWTGTWNVNGGKHFRSVAHKNESMADWLIDVARITRDTRPDIVDFHPLFDESRLTHDIYAVGFEEIVDLNAQNVMRASESNQREWERHMLGLLNAAEPNRPEARFVTLQTVQLVGICLCVFVRTELLTHIHDVQVDQVKTGLSGAAGNKGAVAVRFQLHTTSLCFICAHFAAGQSNVKERNSDFNDVLQRTSFTSNRRILDHDAVFWFGDFNYRIDLSREELLRYVAAGDWETLRKYDQLTRERNNGNAFKDFNEALPNFAPTYKYDLFSDDYDSSEKCRVPAWCDRVLYRSNEIALSKDVDSPSVDREIPDSYREALSLQLYNRVELKTSDHRPVCAIFLLNVFRVDREKRREVLRDILLTGPNDRAIDVTSNSPLTEEQLRAHFRQYGEIAVFKYFPPDPGNGGLTRCKISYYLRSSACSAFKAHANPLDSPTRAGLEVRYQDANWNRGVDRKMLRVLLSEPQENGAASTPVLNELATLLTGFEDTDSADSQSLSLQSDSLSTARSANNLADLVSDEPVQQRAATPLGFEPPSAAAPSRPPPARPPPPRPNAPPKRPDRPPAVGESVAASSDTGSSNSMHESRSTGALLDWDAPLNTELAARGGSERKPNIQPLLDVEPMLERSRSTNVSPLHATRPPRPPDRPLDVDAILSLGDEQPQRQPMPPPPVPPPFQREASSSSLQRNISSDSLKREPANDAPPPPPPTRPRPPPRSLPPAPTAGTDASMGAGASPQEQLSTNASTNSASPTSSLLMREERASLTSDGDLNQNLPASDGQPTPNSPQRTVPAPPPAPPRRKPPQTPQNTD